MEKIWEIILESDLLNFAIVLGLAFYAGQRFFVPALKLRNDELKMDLTRAQEKQRLAEEQLDLAEMELQGFKQRLAQMNVEADQSLSALSTSLKEELREKTEALIRKQQREIEALRNKFNELQKRELTEKAFQKLEKSLKERLLHDSAAIEKSLLVDLQAKIPSLRGAIKP